MRICFWGDIASAINGNTKGGGQLQIALIAKLLAQCGHEVIVLDHETDIDFITSEGIRIVKIKGWDDGFRLIRTFTHRLPQLYRSLVDAKADIYYCRIRDFRHILAYWASRRCGGKFVLGIASDLDVADFRIRWKYTYTVHLHSLWDLVNGILSEAVYPFLLKKADMVLVQHEGQRQSLESKGQTSTIQYNLFNCENLPDESNERHNEFVYIGSLDKRKGFRELVDLIKMTPHYKYKIVGQPRDKTAALLFQELKAFINVELLGRLSHSETMFVLSGARALISTSKWEGFPNIFLEAWAMGIPVISMYVDPGGIVKRNKLGYVARGNFKKMLTAMSETSYSEEFKVRSVNYVKRHHAVNSERINELDCLFRSIVGNDCRTGSR